MKRVLLITLGVLVAGVSFFVYSQTQGKSNVVSRIQSTVDQINTAVSGPTPTPFPFQELTIPYLRARKYESKLGGLEKISENNEYASYLTSYNSDGLAINGFLTIPKGDEPSSGWPAIVFLHGYIPPAQYQTLTQYSSYVDALARGGFVVFKIDLRGHADSEGEASGAYFSGDYIVDTLNAYSALQNSDFVNPRKIGLWGHSMAGNVVLRSMASKPEIPAGVIWAGAVYTYGDMQEYGIDDGSYRPPEQTSQRQQRRQLLRDLYGDYSPESEFWKQMTPVNYLSDLKGALQLNHAVDDNVVTIRYSRNLTSLLDKTSVPHELKEYVGGGHNLSGAVFNQAMQNTINFFRKYL